MSENIWGIVCESLLKSVSKNEFNNWIKPLHFTGIDDGVATFHAPTNFIGNWVVRNYGDMICRHFIAEGTIIDKIAFNVESISSNQKHFSSDNKSNLENQISR